MTTVKRHSRDELVNLVDSVLYPAGKNLAPEIIERNLYTFCLNCPDPGAAMTLVVEAPRGSKSASIVDRAMSMPARPVAFWSEKEIARDHPIRVWKLEGS